MIFRLLPLITVCFNFLFTVAQEHHCESETFSGQCVDCTAGWFGDKCDKPCIGRCDSGGCDKEIGVCLQCMNGIYGLRCKDICPKNCKHSKCDRNTGYCYLCKDTLWGHQCSHKCPENCQGGRCKCRNGSQCDGPCPPGCADGVCSQLEGICNIGCQDGFYDSRCNLRCKKCSRCDQRTGSCLEEPHNTSNTSFGVALACTSYVTLVAFAIKINFLIRRCIS